MKIHEYQAKGILKRYGVAVPRGEMAESREEAEAAAEKPLWLGRCWGGGQGSDSRWRARQGWRREDCEIGR